jgi:hypothetical protein
LTGKLQGGGNVITPLAGLTNFGEINPGDGIGLLTIHGDLNQAASGELNIELHSLNSFDQLAITDDVTLGGALAISNLGYIPMAGDSFVIATFDERLTDSKFTSISIDGFGPGVHFDVIYNEHNVTLAVSAVPEPESLALFLAGLGLIGAVVRRRNAP